jgi:hypothetical protein
MVSGVRIIGGLAEEGCQGGLIILTLLFPLYFTFCSLPIGGVALLLLVLFLDLPTQKTSFADKLKRIDYVGKPST